MLEEGALVGHFVGVDRPKPLQCDNLIVGGIAGSIFDYIELGGEGGKNQGLGRRGGPSRGEGSQRVRECPSTQRFAFQGHLLPLPNWGGTRGKMGGTGFDAAWRDAPVHIKAPRIVTTP